MNRIILCLYLLLTIVYSQNSCLTPNRDNGICINLKECELLIAILTGPRPIPESSLEFLRASQCGFDGKTPKVCCSSITPKVSPTPEPEELTTEASMPMGVSESDPPDVSTHPNLRLLHHNLCGPITQSKIVGGNKTSVLDYPWMALVAYDINGRKEFRCGGTIINKRFILTAAHCVTALPPPLTLEGVRVGEHDLSTERDCDRDKDGLEIVCADGYQDFLIKSFHFHPNYSTQTLQNDVGLIKVDRDIDFTPINVKPICLPIGSAARLRSKKVTVLGWGATDDGPRSQDLLMVTLAPVSNEECAKSYPGRISVWYKQLCAGGKDGKDSCNGDSGGPLLAPAIYNNNNNNVRFIQYGIVSFGSRLCGTEGIPGVYTRITYYLDWILDTIQN